MNCCATCLYISGKTPKLYVSEIDNSIYESIQNSGYKLKSKGAESKKVLELILYIGCENLEFLQSMELVEIIIDRF